MSFLVNFMRESNINPVGGISIVVLICGLGPLIGLKPPAKIPKDSLLEDKTASLDYRSENE
jgi:hypothetical protein